MALKIFLAWNTKVFPLQQFLETCTISFSSFYWTLNIKVRRQKTVHFVIQSKFNKMVKENHTTRWSFKGKISIVNFHGGFNRRLKNFLLFLHAFEFSRKEYPNFLIQMMSNHLKQKRKRKTNSLVKVEASRFELYDLSSQGYISWNYYTICKLLLDSSVV